MMAPVHEVQAGSHLVEGRMREGVGDMKVQLIQQAYRVAGPADRHRGDGKQVLEDQVPADEPRHAFTEGDIRIGIGAAGHRDHRGKFRVAKPRERTTDAGDDEREGQRRTGVLGGSYAC